MVTRWLHDGYTMATRWLRGCCPTVPRPCDDCHMLATRLSQELNRAHETAAKCGDDSSRGMIDAQLDAAAAASKALAAAASAAPSAPPQRGDVQAATAARAAPAAVASAAPPPPSRPSMSTPPGSTPPSTPPSKAGLLPAGDCPATRGSPAASYRPLGWRGRLGSSPRGSPRGLLGGRPGGDGTGPSLLTRAGLRGPRLLSRRREPAPPVEPQAVDRYTECHLGV